MGLPMEKIKAQHDSAWKDILDVYFPQALEVCFPELYDQIDWTREWTSLDKELQAITKDGETGKQYVDKLIRVYLKNGNEFWIPIHLEIEQEPTPKFPERMFLYGSRLFDRYRRIIVSCALLTDESQQRPTFYEIGLGKARLRQDFLLCKLIDFEKKRNELEASTNPFAAVILFHLDSLAAKKQPQQERLQTKISITRHLFEKGFQKQDVINIFRFIDFSISLTGQLELQYQDEIHKIEARRHMSYVSSVERLSEKKGLEKGMRVVALRLLNEGSQIDFIVKITKLTREQVEELREQSLH
jgi:hypothetical protein